MTVFGGSGHKEGTKEWEIGIQVGQLLAKKGFTIVNGGYSGSMTSVAIGAEQQHGKCVGVVVPTLFVERHKNGGANPHLSSGIL